MSDPRVSVIIPVFNGAEFIDKAIEGVFNQSYQNYELLILDDGSTDGTDEVVKKFKDSRIRFVRHEANIGFVANWTYGVRAARGQYLAILGHDDVYRPQFLQRRLEAFEQFSGLTAATGAFECTDSDRSTIRISRRPSEHDQILFGDALFSYVLEYTGEWWIGATLLDTQKVRELWPKVMMAGMALDFALHLYLSILPHSRVFVTPHLDTILRVHSAQESRRKDLYLAECGAKFAHQFWLFEIKHRSKSVRRLFRDRMAWQFNHFARMLWDRGLTIEARQLFACELHIRPTSGLTWLRYFRTFLIKPKPIVK